MMWIRLGRDPVKQYLLELKCAHLSPAWYAPKPWRLQEEAQGKSCLVVEKRAEKVAAEYVRKAQRTDQTYCGTAPGTVGPVAARLRTFDKTVPLVFGAFGEASAAVEQLIDALAEAGADVHWRAMKAKKREEAKGALVWQLRRRWGMAAIRGNARLILLIECSSSSMVAARTRRSQRCGDARGARSGVSARLSCLGSVRASGTRAPPRRRGGRESDRGRSSLGGLG